MRISDWSSDVCSSDLHVVGFGALLDAAVAPDVLGYGQPVVGEQGEATLVLVGMALVVGAGAEGHPHGGPGPVGARSEEHTSELQSLMRISYAVFCLKKKKTNNTPALSISYTNKTN